MNYNYAAQIFPGQTINTIKSLETDVNLMKKMVVLDTTDDFYSFTEKKDISVFPEVIPCKTWTNLLNVFYSIFNAESESKNFWGVAEIDRYCEKYNEKKKALADYLGLSLDYCDKDIYSYVLVRMNNTIGTYDLKKEKAKDILDKCDKMIPEFNFGDIENKTKSENIKSALDILNEKIGTNLIESVIVGESIYQVFVFDAKKFDLICESSKSGWSGYSAMSFQFFTSKVYCLHVGSLKILSGRDLFANKSEKLEDTKYSMSKSIFMIPAQPELLECLENVENVVPLNIMMSPCINPLKSESHDLMKGTFVQACIARYGVESVDSAYYQNENTLDYSAVYSDFCKQDTLTGVWAPYHSFSQLYVNLAKILKSNTLNRNDVKNLVVTADVIEIEEDIDMSNIENLVLGCRLLIAGKKGSVPNVYLSNHVWEKKRLYCEEMKGSCVFCVEGDVTKRRLVFGDIASSFIYSDLTVGYEDFFAGKFPIDVFYDTTGNSVEAWIKETLELGIQVLLSTASVPVSPSFIEENRNKTIAEEAYKCINWIVKYTEEIVLSRDKQNVPTEISSLYASALQIMDKSVDPSIDQQNFLPSVPLLKYEIYDNAIQRLLELSEIYSKQIDEIRKEFIDRNKEISKEYTQEKRDENIKKIAQFMIEQNSALASKEDDIAKYHNDIVDSKNRTLNQLKEQEYSLENDLSNRFELLNQAKDELNQALQEEISKQKTKAILDFVISLGECLSGAFSFYTSAQAIGTGTSEIDNLIKQATAFNNFTSLCKKIMTGSIDAESVISYGKERKEIEEKRVEAPSDLQWKSFLHDVKSEIAPLESICKKETAKYTAALENLVDVGISYNNIREQICQYEYDISIENANKKIAQNQSERLNKISLNIEDVKWSPDDDYYTDLGIFEAFLQQKENNVLLKLIEIARLQNDAMTYYYLSKPCSIKQFEIMAVRNMLISQEMGAISTLESYPNPPTDLVKPIVITLENVPTKKLLDDLGYEFSIELNNQEFNTYARVRINYIDIRVNGIKTDTEHCHVKLVSLGNPMHDRGLQQREPLSYKTVPKDWNVVYNLKTGETETGTKPSEDWKKYYSKQTPFQKYRVSIPKTVENKNIVFDKDFTSVTIQFFVEAVYTEVYQNNLLLQRSFNEKNPYDFLDNLKNQSVTDGWDVVSFISASAINELWEDRWTKEVDDSYKGDVQFLQSIHSEVITPFGSSEFKTKFDMELQAPLLIFKPHDTKNVNIKIPIKKAVVEITFGGSTSKSEYESTAEKPCYLLTECALQSLKGNVDDQGGVFINAYEGTFAVEGITINPLIDEDLCKTIADYVKKENFPPWFLGKIKYQAEENYLKPKKFFFTTYCYKEKEPSEYDVLGIYILTTQNTPPSHGMRISWNSGWVIGNECNAAVYFSSKLLMDNEMTSAFKDKFGPLDKNSDYPNKSFKNSIKLYETKIKCQKGFNTPSVNNITDVEETTSVTLPSSSIKFNFDLNGFSLICNASWNERFPYQYTQYAPANMQYSVHWGPFSFTCKFNTIHVVPTINPDSFIISFPEIVIQEPITASATPKEGRKSGGSWLWPSSIQSPKSFTLGAIDGIKKHFTNVKIQLKKLPMFAVSNILFPEGKMLTPQKVAFPHDMVILGTASRKYTPIATKEK